VSLSRGRVLNVGGYDKSIAIPAHYSGWEHLLLDIDPTTSPDICADAREMTELVPAAYDAIYCSHNLEHYYAHDLTRVLAGFLHVLKSDGFAEIRVPDLGVLMKNVVERFLDIEDTLYVTPAGARPLLFETCSMASGSRSNTPGRIVSLTKTASPPSHSPTCCTVRDSEWSRSGPADPLN
jgi:hypothetical protein